MISRLLKPSWDSLCTSASCLELVKARLEELRRRRILAPALSALDRLASAVRRRVRREAFRPLIAAQVSHENVVQVYAEFRGALRRGQVQGVA